MKKTEEYQSLIITHLHRKWSECIENGLVSRSEMYDILHEQASGEYDYSIDDLDEPIARLLGWDINNLTESQRAEWKSIVDMASKEYITK